MENYVDIVREDKKFKVLAGFPAMSEHGFFWDVFISSWEPFTLSWIKNYSDNSKAFLDIGAWIGPTSLWASSFYKSVYSFEPDPVAYDHLVKNSELNADNINTFNAAITSTGEDIEIYSRGGLGSSMTSMYTGDFLFGSVKGFSLSEALKLDDFGLIKIDIEGGERLLIDKLVEELSNNPIDLIFSFHYLFYVNPEEDFNYIISRLGEVYSNFILENGQSINIKDTPKGFSTIFCSK